MTIYIKFLLHEVEAYWKSRHTSPLCVVTRDHFIYALLNYAYKQIDEIQCLYLDNSLIKSYNCIYEPNYNFLSIVPMKIKWGML